jgi:ribonuclease P protein subunit RPP14
MFIFNFRKLKDKPSEEILPIYIKGAIVKSLTQVFGEIGGLTTVDLLKFDQNRLRGILRIPFDFYVKTRAALTLIAEFQGSPAIFQVNKASQLLLSLIDSYLEI